MFGTHPFSDTGFAESATALFNGEIIAISAGNLQQLRQDVYIKTQISLTGSSFG